MFVLYVCSSQNGGKPLFTHRYPARPVSVLLLHSLYGEMQTRWSTGAFYNNFLVPTSNDCRISYFQQTPYIPAWLSHFLTARSLNTYQVLRMIYIPGRCQAGVPLIAAPPCKNIRATAFGHFYLARRPRPNPTLTLTLLERFRRLFRWRFSPQKTAARKASHSQSDGGVARVYFKVVLQLGSRVRPVLE